MPMVLLLATQRSGTNYLRGILNTHSKIVDCQEVFNDSDPEIRMNGERFWVYFLRRVEEDPKNALPSRRTRMVREYFKSLQKEFPGRWVVPDVKYSSLHHVEEDWYRRNRIPMLIQMSIQREIPLIHLIRRNCLLLVISRDVARTTGTYVINASDPTEVPRSKIQIPQDKLIARIDKALELQVFYQNCLTSHPRLLELYFEDLRPSREGVIPPGPFEKIAAFLEVAPDFDLAAQTKKITPENPFQIIENAEEVRAAVLDSPHAWMLEDIPAAE